MNSSQVKLAGLALVAVAIALSVAGARALKGITTARAATTVRVERDAADLPELGSRAAAGTDLAFFMQTEAELVESEAVLGKVVEELDLNHNHSWGERYAGGQTLKTSESIRILKERVHAQPLPNSTLLEIQAASPTADEAIKLAETVAKVYCAYRIERRRQLAQTAIDTLDPQFKTLDQAAREAQEKVAAAQSKLDPATRGNLSSINLTNNETLRLWRNRQSEATLRYLTASNQLANLLSNHAPTNAIAQVEAKATRAKSDLEQIDAAARKELETAEALRTYQTAQQESQEADRLFAHAKRTMDELQTKLKPAEKPPAVITEPAALIKADTGKTSQGKQLLFGGGLALAAGLALLLFPTLVATKPQV